MHHNSISYLLLISLKKSLNNIKTHLDLGCHWEVCYNVKEGLKSEYIADILGSLKNNCQEIAEGLKDWGIEVSNILEKIAESLKDKTIESVLFISR